MSAPKSRLLLYLILLPGLAIPSAVMLWFPDAYTTAFLFVHANPLVMLVIAIVACASFWYYAADGIPDRLRGRFWLFVFLTTVSAIAYVSVNFNSLAIAEAMVAGGLAVGFVALLIKDFSARKRDT